MKTTHRLATVAAFTAVASLASAAAHEGAPLAQGGKPEERLQALGKAVAQQLDSTAKKQLYVMIDKPLYHPGETVWFRAWETSVKTLAPVAGDHAVTFQLFDPKGAKVMEKRVLARGGMATNDFTLGEGIPGGPYVLRAISELGATLDRAVVVSSYEAPRIKKTLDFLRKSYGPGDEVTAHLLLEKPTGEPLAGKAVAVVTVDGAEIGRFPVFTDEKGRGFLRFTLPASIARGDALVTLLVDAGGISESLQRRIPIALDQVDVKAYPEGGDLVTGLPSRVYFSARDPQGKPVDVEGEVVDDRGQVVAGFRSFHAGMARVALTPAAGRSYSVRLQKPRAASSKSFALPAAKASGCTMHTLDDFTGADAEVKVKVQCTEAQDVLATAVLRESLVSRTSARTFAGAGTVLSLPVDRGATGAVRVTLFDLAHHPLAERLVYRGLGSEMRISVKADKASYAPRDKVTLTVETRDAKGKGVPADVALAVVDDTVLRFADDKKTAAILAQTYLLPEMPGQEVLEPNFYFSKDPKAPEAMDLLLGTQGWRRFAWRWVQ
jgi:hypothetical protein